MPAPDPTRTFLTDAAERIAATFVETFAAVEGSDVVAHGLTISGTRAAAIAGLAAALAVLKTVAARFVGQKDSAALLPASADQKGHGDLLLVVAVLCLIVGFIAGGLYFGRP